MASAVTRQDEHPAADAALIARIAATTGVSHAVARRVVDDVLAHFAETLEQYLSRRHRELAAEGWKNADIFECLQREIAERPFRVSACSLRQIRRIIYG